MSAPRRLLPQARRLGLALRPKAAQAQSKCPYCSLAPASRPLIRSHRDETARRHQSTSAPSSNPRQELEHALAELQNHAPSLVDASRLQLALQGLRHSAGTEAVRIAILGLGNGSSSTSTAKRLLRALLADPLVDQEAWERELDAYDVNQPLIVRIQQGDVKSGLTMERHASLNEITISSPTLNGANLELLLMDTVLPMSPPEGASASSVESSILNPVVDIPIGEDRYSQVETPVHKTILITDGFSGAVSISAASGKALDNVESVIAATNIPGMGKQASGAQVEVIDLSLAEKAIGLFRQGPQHAMEYEKLWTTSNVSVLVHWLKQGIHTTDGATKPIVRRLIASVLQGVTAQLDGEEARELSKALGVKELPERDNLNQALAQWSQNAHSELQSELDQAFTGRRWRKLGWWKLFWRVDDVAMLTNEMLSQRFLPTAEQEIVYLTGRIAGPKGVNPNYAQPKSSQVLEHKATKLGSGEEAPIPTGLPRWPGHIAFTRRYLQNESVPALQALAQKLVMQSLGTSGIATSLAATFYLTSFVSTAYEAGAVAALGIVYSLGRMQKKWETARGFWEGDVREEGRKAVRGAEKSIADALNGGKPAEDAELSTKIQKTRELLAQAEDALGRMK
ncbi:unnamed protein product [Clonostachys rosea f. rosea IK726]|uniref:Mmc1 C-terminal domain-containing protein n=2 Tax=Bionectria ochroleuca TaxID=29856 RepID=A0A0B7KN42_BIOOC|nr:unnamed protein product [Clonostachys rosea f. rosea IK726]